MFHFILGYKEGELDSASWVLRRLFSARLELFYTFLWRPGFTFCVCHQLYFFSLSQTTSKLHVRSGDQLKWWMKHFCSFSSAEREKKKLDNNKKKTHKSSPSHSEKMKKLCAECGWNGENLRNLFHFILMNFEHGKKKTLSRLFVCRRSASCDYIYRRV